MTNNWTSLHYLLVITLGGCVMGEPHCLGWSQHNRNGSQINIDKRDNRPIWWRILTCNFAYSFDGWIFVVFGRLREIAGWPQFVNHVRHTNWPMDGYLKMSLGNQWPSLPYLVLCAVWKFDWIAWNIWIWVESNYL